MANYRLTCCECEHVWFQTRKQLRAIDKQEKAFGDAMSGSVNYTGMNRGVGPIGGNMNGAPREILNTISARIKSKNNIVCPKCGSDKVRMERAAKEKA